MNDLFFEKNQLYGVVANTPENITSIYLGDTIIVNTIRLSDWMYIQNGKLVGGNTMKVIYNGLNDAHRKEMEKGLGAKIK